MTFEQKEASQATEQPRVPFRGHVDAGERPRRSFPSRPRPPERSAPGPRSAAEIAFAPPRSIPEARKRIADLDYDIAHIDQQFAARDARGGGDPDWRHRASRARMMKDLERSRLLIWLDEQRKDSSEAFLRAVVDIVKADYEEEEWRDILSEARKRIGAAP